MCPTVHKVTVRDLLYQPDYAGLDYEDGGQSAEVQCGDECGGLYVTRLCEGNPEFDSGNCPDCNKHYFQWLTGFDCDNCERKRSRASDCSVQ